MLGEPQSLENNPGGLVPGQNGAFTYMYIDAISKLVFHIGRNFLLNAFYTNKLIFHCFIFFKITTLVYLI